MNERMLPVNLKPPASSLPVVPFKFQPYAEIPITWLLLVNIGEPEPPDLKIYLFIISRPFVVVFKNLACDSHILVLSSVGPYL